MHLIIGRRPRPSVPRSRDKISDGQHGYGEQLAWRLVLIGLTEQASQYVERGYTPLRGAQSQLRFRGYGMPFAPQPKERVSATARACRAVVAARLLQPGSEWRVFRALQLANFTTPLLLDEDDQIKEMLQQLAGWTRTRSSPGSTTRPSPTPPSETGNG